MATRAVWSDSADRAFRELVKALGTEDLQRVADELKKKDPHWAYTKEQVHNHLEANKKKDQQPKEVPRGRPSKKRKVESDDLMDNGGFVSMEGVDDEEEEELTAEVSYGPKLGRPALLLLPQEIKTQHYRAYLWQLMNRTDVTFLPRRLEDVDLITVEVRSIAVDHREAETGVRRLFTGVRPFEDMASADVMNPAPLPPNVALHMDEYSARDIAMAIHRPETALVIDSPLNQKFCFDVPEDCSLDITPLVVKPAPDFPYHGLALGLRASDFAPLEALRSAESELVSALQHFGRRQQNIGSGGPNPTINIAALPPQPAQEHVESGVEMEAEKP